MVLVPSVLRVLKSKLGPSNFSRTSIPLSKLFPLLDLLSFLGKLFREKLPQFSISLVLEL
jgi:hypothetical protein